MIKASIQWNDSGLRNLEREIMDSAMQQVRLDIEATVRHLRCSIHGKTPTVSFTRTAQGMTAHLDGCCDAIVKRAEAAIS